MSEYQYYEFQTVDRSLTREEQQAVRGLSSHIDVSPSRAWVEYSWGDFKHDPQQVVAKYFDALLYTTNWGTHQLMFRFPRGAVETKLWQPYLYPDSIMVDEMGDFIILTIDLSWEEGGDWVEVEDTLSGLIPLREDLLRGDLRALYLAWLQAALTGHEEGDELADEDDDFEDEDEDEDEDDDYEVYSGGSFRVKAAPGLVEPPVPPNLQKLSPALQEFIEFFEINPDLVTAAAAASANVAVKGENLVEQIPLLSEAEKNVFLVRLLRGEPRLDLALAARLRALRPPEKPATPKGTRRSVQSLIEAAEVQEQERTATLKRQQEAEHARKMQALAPQENQLWAQVYQSTELKTTKGYNNAAKALELLEALALYQKRLPEFRAKVAELRARYPRLTGFQQRLNRFS